MGPGHSPSPMPWRRHTIWRRDPIRRNIPALLGAAAIGLGQPGAALAQDTAELREQVRELTERLDELENRGQVNLPAGTTLTFGGYTKLDLIYDLDQGQGDTTSVRTLTLGADDGGGFDAHARQTRLNFKTETQTEKGPLTTFVEVDFFGTRGNDVLSNSHQLRLRHAYGRWNGWTAGQTWTTFMPIEVYPATVDFRGPTGLPFIRQAQLRYTLKAAPNFDVSLAIENPEFSGRGVVGGVTAPLGETIGSTFSGVNSDFDQTPDFLAAGTWKSGEHLLRGAVVVRDLEGPSQLGGDSDTGWGFNLAGGTPLWEGGRLVGSFTYGDGIGRYIIDGIGQDAFIDATGELNTIEAYGATAQVMHAFSDKVSAGLAYGFYEVEDTFAPTDTEKLQTVHLSLFYKPVKRLTVGAEVSRGEREVASGADIDATRLQGSVQFNF